MKGLKLNQQSIIKKLLGIINYKRILLKFVIKIKNFILKNKNQKLLKRNKIHK